jgi:PAS domain-containing protein
MLAVVGISLVGLWNLFQLNQSPAMRRFHLLVVLVFVVFLAFAVFLKEYVANRELVADVHESEDRLAGIVASAMDAIIAVNDEQRIVLFNHAAEKMFGCSAADVIGSSIERFIPPAFRGKHDAHISRFGNSGVTARAMGPLGVLRGLRAVVLVAAFDRVARSTRHFLHVVDEFDSLGIEFVSRR